ncbi:hypothetical protein GCM10025759_16840 [Lysobacter panacisoli]|uniref:Ferric oxidoreductase domain-containing protein n=1 Tax=Lysobacter panacisoli TaxID=1255263 RepID=A0ABP9LD42_9GAMM
MNAPPVPSSSPFPSEPWRRTFEVGFWIVLTLFNAVANSITVLIDIRNSGLDFASWEPVSWEWSSAVLMLALAPAVIWFSRRMPIHWDNWRRALPWHLLASVVFCLVHVVGMVGHP